MEPISSSDKTKQPVSSILPANRILSIDVLRGVAVLGILIMNIQHFSMIGAAYINPDAYGDLTGINKWIWILSHLLTTEKFMGIFSILFGAGIILFTTHIVEKGRRAGPLHYRRNFWLLIFGLLHAYLIWYGDILVAYSLCAFLAFLFRKMKPKKLVIIGVLFFIIPILLYLMFGATVKFWPEESYNQNMQTWLPTVEKVHHEIASMQGNWLAQMDVRIPGAIFMETFLFFIQVFWRVMGLMLLGMALFKWGILSASRSNQFYLRLTLLSLIPGMLIVAWGIHENFAAQWQMPFSMFTGILFNYIGSIGVSLGYIGIVMLICKSAKWLRFNHVFSSVGKMAFSNYIMTSIICSFIFYGHGFALFGEVERWVQILIVPGIWIILIIFSLFWLRSYYYGPLEWLWRVLTYWHRQPMRRKTP
ncbi:MAG: DUF418 domain-containing protein [Bacteroidia bacterium]|nr:DUF418 domain-containing protein [Bacteroidia bacterium]